MSQTFSLDEVRAKLAASKPAKQDNGRFDAPKLDVMIGEEALTAEPRVFSTGGLGWYGRQRASIHGLDCTIQVTVTVNGSKPRQDGNSPVRVQVSALDSQRK